MADDIYNGADDNGTGTAALLAIAEALTHYGALERSVLLLWVSAEEKGLRGSAAWTQDPWLPGEAVPFCDINLDMVGRNDPAQILVTPSSAREEYNDIVRLVEELAPLEGFTDIGECDQYWGRSDHANFARNLGIPVAFIFSDVHEDYHQPTDTADKVDYGKVRRVSRLAMRMLERLQAEDSLVNSQ